MEENDKGVLQLEPDQWQAHPLLSDGSFLSADEVVNRDVKFSFRVFSTRQDGDSTICDVEVGTEQTFIVNYHPGKPSSIAVISPLSDDILELKAGDNVPPIKIACFDEFGNRTASHQCESWHLKLDIDGPLQSLLDTAESYDIPVLPSGEATLTNFKIRRMVGAEGSVISHVVFLETLDFLDYGVDPPRLSMNIKVKPSHYPVEIEVLYEGDVVPNSWTLPVVSTIIDLSYRILDEGGEVINLSDLGYQKNRQSGLTKSRAQINAKNSIAIALNSEVNDDSYHDDVGGSRRSERNNKRKRGEEMVCRTIIDLRSRGNIYLDNRKLITFI